MLNKLPPKSKFNTVEQQNIAVEQNQEKIINNKLDFLEQRKTQDGNIERIYSDGAIYRQNKDDNNFYKVGNIKDTELQTLLDSNFKIGKLFEEKMKELGYCI